MTRTLPLALLLAASLAMTGCNLFKKDKSAEVPPPPSADADAYAADPGFQPVQVTPATGYADPAPAPAATPGGTYTIQKGDTFIGIARRVYGNESKFKDIIAANPGVNPNKLQVGQVINLP